VKPKTALTERSTPFSYGNQTLVNQPTCSAYVMSIHVHVLLLQQEILEGRKSAKPPHRLPESIQKELDKRSIGNRCGIHFQSV
jgi:hypothetical protein